MTEDSNRKQSVPPPTGSHADLPTEDRRSELTEEEREELPNWWRQALEVFEAYNLPQYRPPRFTDGTLKHEVVADLEDELNISILFLGIKVSYQDNWTVRVDGEDIGKIGRHRSKQGYTEYEMPSDEFTDWIRSEVSD